jgi:hypothetical protein
VFLRRRSRSSTGDLWGGSASRGQDPGLPSWTGVIDAGLEKSSGSVQRSVFRGGTFAIDLENGATATIGKDNVFEGNVENRATFGTGLEPAPPPPLPPPPKL